MPYTINLIEDFGIGIGIGTSQIKNQISSPIRKPSSTELKEFDQNDCKLVEKSNCWEKDGKWCSDPNFKKSDLGKWQCNNCSVCRSAGGTAPLKLQNKIVQKKSDPPQDNIIQNKIKAPIEKPSSEDTSSEDPYNKGLFYEKKLIQEVLKMIEMKDIILILILINYQVIFSFLQKMPL